MTPISVTKRTITTSWDRETQEHTKQVTETSVLVNPDHIVFAMPISDAPEKYATHLRMVGGWDLFVVEPADRIEQRIEVARELCNSEVAAAHWRTRAVYADS